MLEIINLDDLSEAAALTILSVDEKVASSSSPSVSASSPSPFQVSAVSQSVPPGQWVKMFTKFEDLHYNLRQPDSSVKFEDGAIVATKATSLHLSKPGTPGIVKNGGWRAPIRKGTTFEMRARDTHTPKEQLYAMDPNRVAFIERKDGAMIPAAMACTARDSRQPQHMWELAAMGGRIIARCDSKLVCAQEDNRVAEGRLMLANFTGTIRDIEAINLNGLSEGEALRLLGVDEKGNDLRGVGGEADGTGEGGGCDHRHPGIEGNLRWGDPSCYLEPQDEGYNHTLRTNMPTFQYNTRQNPHGGYTASAVKGRPISDSELLNHIATEAGTTPAISEAVIRSFTHYITHCSAGCIHANNFLGLLRFFPTCGGSSPSPDGFQTRRTSTRTSP